MELIDRLIKFATLRPRSEFEINCWFKRKKVSEKDTSAALEELKKAGLVDDEAFAKWWVEQRMTFRPKSQRMLVVELVRKGVDKKLAAQVVEKSGLNEEELTFQIIERRSRMLDRLDPETRKKKITSILTARGFGWGVIRKLIENKQSLILRNKQSLILRN